MIAGNKTVKPEGLARNCRIDRPSPFAISLKGFAAPTTLNLILLAAARKVVLVWVDREKHPEVPLRIDVEHEQVSVLLDPDLNRGMFAGKELTIVVDPDLNWWVLP
jgi:hypothetical protein